MTTVCFDRVQLRYDEHVVLHEIELTLTEQRIGVIGCNGSGKSTLARLINGLVHPSAGRVTVDGLDVVKHGAQVRSRVGFVFTNPDSQIVMPTVQEDVAFSLRRLRLPAPEAAERTHAALERFGIANLADRPAHRLSGGQKQLLALASILVTEPQLVVADEPTTLLDARNARLIAEHFAALEQQLVLVTHHLDTLQSFDRVIVIDEGRVVADDQPKAAIAFYERLASL